MLKTTILSFGKAASNPNMSALKLQPYTAGTLQAIFSTFHQQAVVEHGPTDASLLQALDDRVHALHIVRVEAAVPVLDRSGPMLQARLVQLPLSGSLLLIGHAHLPLQLLCPALTSSVR